MTEQDVAKALWLAVDRVAAEQGLSLPALARRCGIATNTLSEATRRGSEGRLRLPSMATVAALISTTGMNLSAFAAKVDQPATGDPLAIHMDFDTGHAAALALDEAGVPKTENGAVDFHPLPQDQSSLYAIQLSRDAPSVGGFKDDVLVVNPKQSPRIGHRVVARIQRSGLVLGRLAGGRIHEVRIRRIDEVRTFPRRDVLWLHVIDSIR